MPTQPSLNQKQYFVLSQVKISAFQILRPNTVVMLDPEVALPLMSANLICPLLTAIKQGLYPLKEEENFISAAIKEVKEAVKETQAEITSALPKAPPQASALIENMKASTKERNTHTVAFENALRKKIQDKKKHAKSSAS